MSNFYFTNDLMFASNGLAAAQAQGQAMRMVASLESLLAEAATSGCRFVILDLALPGIAPNQLVSQLKAAYPQVKIVAYAPHVHGQLMQEAAEAGCDEVLTRGQFHQQMGRLLATYLSSE
jgi:DNA-binding NarL/FixJ family response regulator